MPKEQFKHEVEATSYGQDSEPSDIIYFKLYKSQIPVVEEAIETAALILGSDKSRGYCLEMICADFLAGAHATGGDPEVLLEVVVRSYQLMAREQRIQFLPNSETTCHDPRKLILISRKSYAFRFSDVTAGDARSAEVGVSWRFTISCFAAMAEMTRKRT